MAKQQLPQSPVVPTYVPFHDSQILTVKTSGQIYVAAKSVCEALGIQWAAQYKRIKRDTVLSEGMSMMDIQAGSSVQAMSFMTLPNFHGWLLSIDDKRIKNPDAREAVLTYKRESYQTIAEFWQGQDAKQRRTDPPALPAAEADRARRMALGQPLLNDAVRAEIDRQAQLLSSRTAPHYRNRLLTEALKIFPDSPEMIPTLAETIWANEQSRDEIDGVPVAWMREGYELCVSWLTYTKSSALPPWLKASKLECWEGDMERFGRHFESDWP